MFSLVSWKIRRKMNFLKGMKNGRLCYQFIEVTGGTGHELVATPELRVCGHYVRTKTFFCFK